MRALFQKLAFAGVASLCAAPWIPLSFLFVTVYVPAKAVPCTVRRGDKVRALITAPWATWPIRMAAVAIDLPPPERRGHLLRAGRVAVGSGA